MKKTAAKAKTTKAKKVEKPKRDVAPKAQRGGKVIRPDVQKALKVKKKVRPARAYIKIFFEFGPLLNFLSFLFQIVKGTNIVRYRKIRTSVHFRRPKTFKTPRNPKYPRKSVPKRNR